MIEFFTLLLLSGALLYHSLEISLPHILIISTVMGAFFFMYFLSVRGLVLALCIGMTIVLGACTVWYHAHSVPAICFGDRTIEGEVQRVDRRLDKTIVTVEDQRHCLLEVTAEAARSVLPKDIVRARGTVMAPKDFMTDTGRVFPYQAYLASKGIVGRLSAPLTIVSTGNISLSRLAAMMRFAIADTFSAFMTFPTDGLVAGMTVGYQGGVPQSIQNLFRTTGVLHVLVLSGENITLLAVFLSVILRALPLHIRSILTGIAVVLIVCISGAGVSALRAGIMAAIALLGGIARRKYLPLRALTVSIIIFFFLSPETIFSDPGFHLSILATVFMIIVLPKIEIFFYFLPKRFALRELCILALCVPIWMLPYTMYFSGLFSAAAPFANIVMTVLVPVFMVTGALVLAISWLGPLAHSIGGIASFVGKETIALLGVLNTLPQFNTPPLAWWGVVSCYLVLSILFFQKELMQFWTDLKNSFLPQTSSFEP